MVPFSLRPKPAAPVAVGQVGRTRVRSPRRVVDAPLGDRLDLTFGTSPQRLPVAAIVATARQAGVDLDVPGSLRPA
ncbi:MAG: hypothetical protein R2710_14190 [Acidimicrobiales bacterium]